MLILNPFYATSSTDSFLEEGSDSVVCPLLETSGHKLLYKAFPQHQVYRALLRHQSQNGVDVGTWVVTEVSGCRILSVGIGREMTEDEIGSCISQFNIHRKMSNESVLYVPSELKGLPGVDQLIKSLQEVVSVNVNSVRELHSACKDEK
jgi:hypothetical protein